MIREATDGTNDALELFRREIGWSEVLNHVIKDKESEFEALLFIASEALWNDFIADFLNKAMNVLSVGLEKGTHELSSGNLQVELVGILLLNHGHVIRIKNIVLILSLIVVELVILHDSFKRLGHDIDGFLAYVLDFFSRHQTYTSLVNNILESLNLYNQSVCI